MTAVLEIKDTGIRFGGLVALKDVNIDVPEWEIVGLIGPNGAGKTTLFNCIMGAYQPNTGTITYRGRDISLLPTHRRVALGIGRTFQNIGLVRGLTVLENCMVAQHPASATAHRAHLLGSPRIVRRGTTPEELRDGGSRLPRISRTSRTRSSTDSPTER